MLDPPVDLDAAAITLDENGEVSGLAIIDGQVVSHPAAAYLAEHRAQPAIEGRPQGERQQGRQGQP
jgi:hypothetical protein